MCRLKILVGPPCSGKSTYASTYKNKPNWVIISRDAFREALGAAYSTELEEVVKELKYKGIEQALLKGFNVIVDETNAKLETIVDYKNRYNHLADIQFRVFDEPLALLLKRNKKRAKETGKNIPEDAIEMIAADLNGLKAQFDFHTIKQCRRHTATYNYDPLKPITWIFDLDGTISDNSWRNPFKTRLSVNDPLVGPVHELLLCIQQTEDNVIFLTGRSSYHEKQTRQWIEDYLGIKDATLFMRPKDDERADYTIKEEIFLNQIKPYYNVAGVFEDRLSVCDMWFKNGVFTFNVNQGLLAF